MWKICTHRNNKKTQKEMVAKVLGVHVYTAPEKKPSEKKNRTYNTQTTGHAIFAWNNFFNYIF